MSGHIRLWLVAFVLLGSGAAQAQSRSTCLPYKFLVQKVTTGQWQEVKTAQAVAGNKEIHLYLSAKGTFTLFYRSPHAPYMACLLATGTDWHFVKSKTPVH